MFQKENITILILIFCLIYVTPLFAAKYGESLRRDLDKNVLMSNEVRQQLTKSLGKYYDSYLNTKLRRKLIEPLKNLHLMQRNSR